MGHKRLRSTWRLTITSFPPPRRDFKGRLHAGVICKLHRIISDSSKREKKNSTSIWDRDPKFYIHKDDEFSLAKWENSQRKDKLMCPLCNPYCKQFEIWKENEKKSWRSWGGFNVPLNHKKFGKLPHLTNGCHTCLTPQI